MFIRWTRQHFSFFVLAFTSVASCTKTIFQTKNRWIKIIITIITRCWKTGIGRRKQWWKSNPQRLNIPSKLYTQRHLPTYAPLHRTRSGFLQVMENPENLEKRSYFGKVMKRSWKIFFSLQRKCFHHFAKQIVGDCLCMQVVSFAPLCPPNIIGPMYVFIQFCSRGAHFKALKRPK